MCPLSQGSIDPKKEGDLLMVNGLSCARNFPKQGGQL